MSSDDQERQIIVTVAEMAGREGTDQAYIAEADLGEGIPAAAFGRTPGASLRALADRLDGACAVAGFPSVADQCRRPVG